MAGEDAAPVRFRFQAEVIYWRGPAPFFFVAIPQEHILELRQVAKTVTYGWGMVPVEAKIDAKIGGAKIGAAIFSTSLFPKDETYLLPLKAAVRLKAGVTVSDLISVEVTVNAVQR